MFSDCSNASSGVAVRDPERSLATFWLKMIVAIARPVNPPRTRAWPIAPCADAVDTRQKLGLPIDGIHGALTNCVIRIGKGYYQGE